MSDYISPISPTSVKREEHEKLQEDITDFIIDGGAIDIYSSTGRLIGSHLNI